MNAREACAPGFYLVTDAGLSRGGILNDVEEALRAGCRIVQYREKAKNTRTMIEEAEAIARLCKGKAAFLVNDRVDVALAVDADGVHIGQEDMPFETARRLLGSDRIIGLTTHTVAESEEAARLGADYIGLSPIFPTGTKKDAGEACGIARIEEVKKRVALPIVAIGGISLATAPAVRRAGADAVAALSAVLAADSVYEAVRSFLMV